MLQHILKEYCSCSAGELQWELLLALICFVHMHLMSPCSRQNLIFIKESGEKYNRCWCCFLYTLTMGLITMTIGTRLWLWRTNTHTHTQKMNESRNTSFLFKNYSESWTQIYRSWHAAACKRASKRALSNSVRRSVPAVGLTLGLCMEGLVAKRWGEGGEGGGQPQGEWLSGSLPLWSSLQQPTDTQQWCRDAAIAFTPRWAAVFLISLFILLQR